MQKFMDENVITHNLMSFSAFKGMLIFTMLVEEPRTYKEIQSAIEQNEYLKETISFDTIRVYINSLRKIGCDVQVLQDGRTKKYYIASHPFELSFSDNQIKSIIKIYKAISKSIDISDFMLLKGFIDKICRYIKNEELTNKLAKISPLNKINDKLIVQLQECVKNNAQITVLYNSSTSGKKEINILVNKMYISNGKLYIAGFNSEHNNYSSFLVSKIIKILNVNSNTTLKIPVLKVQYRYKKNDNTSFETIKGEKIVSEDDNSLIVEISNENKFMISQRIFSLADKCEVISPQDYKDEVISCLKKMKEGYFEL